MRKLLALILLFLASPTYAQVAQNQILPSVYFGDGVVVSTSTSPTAKLGAMATSSLGLPTFPDLLSYLTLSAWYATTTDALDEGSTNLYYTNGRVQTFLDSIAKGYFFATTSADYWLTTKSTSNLTEGSNLYYTEARVQAELLDGDNAVFGNSTTTNATTTNLSVSTAFNFLGTVITNVSTWFSGLFDTRFATKTTTDLTEGTNLYYTLARWASAMAGTTTDALAEGSTNQYFTTARTRSALSATYPILYNSSTGVISTDISTTTIQHNSLAGLQGGTTNEYYHLTSANASLVNNLDTDLATFSLPANTTISTYGKTLVDDANSTLAVQTLGLDTDLQTMVLQPNLTIATGTVNSLTYYSGENTLSGISTSTGLGISHSTLANLSAGCTDHTTLFCMSGRAGGQTIYGGLNASESLRIQGSADIGTGADISLNENQLGNVGIWTASPTVTLDVDGSVLFNKAAVAGRTFIVKSDNQQNMFKVDSTTDKVGIATATPYQELSVDGDVAITGGIYDSLSSIGSSGQILKSTGTGINWLTTLPVANGGTGINSFGTGVATWLGTPSSANLASAVTDETGSGALVFGTSPAFTTGLSTPAITTASGALTVTPAAGSNLNVALSTTGDFTVNTDDLFVDTSNGRIGVGTAVPTQVFDIETNENANSIFLLKNASSTGTSAAGVIRVSGDTALTQVIAHGSGRTISRYGITLGGWSEIAPSAGNGMILGTINATPLVFGTASNATEAMRITTGNFIGIGTTTPAWLVSIQSASDTNILALKDSDGQCLHNPESASETVTCSSDVKLKKNISDYDKALDYLNVYKVRKYTVKASGDELVGAIAQEVQKVHPETVRDMKDGTLGVDIPSTWILVAGIQELNALHEQDVARITELENRVKALDGKDATPPVPVESKIPWASVATVVGGLGAGFVGSKIGKKK